MAKTGSAKGEINRSSKIQVNLNLTFLYWTFEFLYDASEDLFAYTSETDFLHLDRSNANGIIETFYSALIDNHILMFSLPVDGHESSIHPIRVKCN